MEPGQEPPRAEGEVAPSLCALEVPLEPYPHPELRAIDGDGFEFPPPPLPPAEKFEKMVRQYQLRRVAAKRTLPSESALEAENEAERSEEALGGKLTTAVRSLDDAIMDLLGVAHLIRVVRTDKSFVANETLATAWSESQLPYTPLPYSVTPLEFVIELKKKTYRRAASDLSDWVERTQRLLTKGRRLTQSLSTVRRLTCLVALGPTPTAGLLRPLSVSDPIGVRVTPPPRPTPLPEAVSSTRNEAPVEEPEPQPPIVLRLLPDGTPSLPPLRSKPSCLAFRLIHGPSRSSQCATLHLPALGLNRDLAASLKALDDDLTARGLFEALRAEAGRPGQAWTDRHGLAWGHHPTPDKEAMVVEAEGEEEGDQGGGARRGAGVVCVREGLIMVEVDDAHVLSIQLGEQTQAAGTSQEPAPGNGAEGPRAEALKRLSRLAHLVLIDGYLKGRGQLLADTSTLLRHRIYRDQVSRAVRTVVREFRVTLGLGLEMTWLECGTESPTARLLLAGGAAFVVDLCVGDGDVTLATSTAWTTMGRARIERISDLSRYLGLHLARLVVHSLVHDLEGRDGGEALLSRLAVREVDNWTGVAGVQVPGVLEVVLWHESKRGQGEGGVRLECRVTDAKVVEALRREGVTVKEGGEVEWDSVTQAQGMAGKVHALLLVADATRRPGNGDK